MAEIPTNHQQTIAAGEEHSLGLKADGSIVAWGNNGSGQCDVPAPNTDFVAITAGYDHSVALKADGSIVAWGDDYYGQCDVPLGLYHPKQKVVDKKGSHKSVNPNKSRNQTTPERIAVPMIEEKLRTAPLIDLN